MQNCVQLIRHQLVDLRDLTRQRVIQIQAYRRFRHRQSITGKPLYYVAMVARKLANLPDVLLAGDLVEAD